MYDDDIRDPVQDDRGLENDLRESETEEDWEQMEKVTEY